MSLGPEPSVLEVLSQCSDMKEILWNFIRRPSGKDPDEKKRLTLIQHPHFYRFFPDKYEGGFRTYPTETFYQDQISVLADNPGQAGRVYPEILKRKRVFTKSKTQGMLSFSKVLSFLLFILSLKPFQIPLKRSRVNASFVRSFKIHPTYGVLKNLRGLGLGLTPLNSRFRLLRFLL